MSEKVTSVNGATGAITLIPADYDLQQETWTLTMEDGTIEEHQVVIYKETVLISFIVWVEDLNQNFTYQAEEGMTWEEWVTSQYNTDGFYIQSSGGIDSSKYLMIEFCREYDGTTGVSKTETIIANHYYYALISLPF